MNEAANCAQRVIEAEMSSPRCARRSDRRHVLLSLFIAFGVLAFIFSSTSPSDDDIQQEFCKTSKSKQGAFANYKAVFNLRIFRVRAVYSALAPPAPQFPSHFGIAQVFVPGNELKDTLCSSRTGDRSPPTASS